jgi:hypothetical protein
MMRDHFGDKSSDSDYRRFSYKYIEQQSFFNSKIVARISFAALISSLPSQPK